MGFGDRGQIYASYAQQAPDKMEIVGCVDPDPVRLNKAKELYHLKEENCFIRPADFYAREKFSDAVINATMDSLHVQTTLPLLRKGYDVLLEKPVTSDPQALLALADEAKRNGRVLMICHVLRYAPFYRKIKDRLLKGDLGRIEHIYCSENVGIPHMLSSYVRGKWGSEKECGSGMLMAKCCHDLDLIVWLNGGVKPEEISSFGARSVFTEENKPAGAGTRCLVDCPIEKDCPYSARKLYVENDRFPFLIWSNVPGKDWTEVNGREQRIALLKESNPHGACALSEPRPRRSSVRHDPICRRQHRHAGHDGRDDPRGQGDPYRLPVRRNRGVFGGQRVYGAHVRRGARVLLRGKGGDHGGYLGRALGRRSAPGGGFRRARRGGKAVRVLYVYRGFRYRSFTGDRCGAFQEKSCKRIFRRPFRAIGLTKISAYLIIAI